MFFQSGQIGLGDLHIDLPREQQRDIDADPLANQLLDRRQAFRRRRHLDHQILAVDVLPKPLGLGNRALGIHGEIGRHLQADEPVGSFEAIIDRSQHIRRKLDVLGGEQLEQFGDRAIAALERLGQFRRGVAKRALTRVAHLLGELLELHLQGLRFLRRQFDLIDLFQFLGGFLDFAVLEGLAGPLECGGRGERGAERPELAVHRRNVQLVRQCLHLRLHLGQLRQRFLRRIAPK